MSGAKAHGLDQLDAGDAGRARAVDHELGLLDVAPGHFQRVEQAGRGDDGGPVLVVVEDRDVHQLLEPLLDDEAVRRLDVLEVDAAEGGAEIAHAVDEGVGVLGIDFEIDRIHVGEALEQHRLASITGLDASAPRLPRPRMAVPFEITATMLPRVV